MSTRIFVFATMGDLATLLARFESLEKVRFGLMGSYNWPRCTVFGSGGEIPDLGLANSGDYNCNRSFLIARRFTRFRSYTVLQDNLRLRFDFDQLKNPKTIVFTIGGVFNHRAIIASEIGTASCHSQSIQLYGHFQTAIRESFSRVQDCYVGSEARSMGLKGCRLTWSVKLPADRDLHLSE